MSKQFTGKRGAEFRAAVIEICGGPFDRRAVDEAIAQELRMKGVDPNATAESVRAWADEAIAKQKVKKAARKAKAERKAARAAK